MNRSQLLAEIKKKRTYLCVGLDTDPEKIPAHLRSAQDPIFEFNKQIIDATHEWCVAYKPNIAFYEALGPKGWESLQRTLEYIPEDHFTIADAKRGDIGNTSTMYAKAFFEQMDFDAITVAPYMGADSVTPFLAFKDKVVILLVHTSNPGSADFQLFQSAEGRTLYEAVIRKSQSWGTTENLMYVVGATRADKIAEIRKLAPDHFFLVPGVGAQGGDLKEVSQQGMTRDCGLLVNSARAIIYASSDKDFGRAAQHEAQRTSEEMSQYLSEFAGW
jgi:orotidine-5'-phosphate decarboxylase